MDEKIFPEIAGGNYWRPGPKTGGPAFPAWDALGNICAPGMTLRDYFAAKAMVVLLPMAPAAGIDMDRVASDCYYMADAMLAERSRDA